MDLVVAHGLSGSFEFAGDNHLGFFFWGPETLSFFAVRGLSRRTAHQLDLDQQ